MLGSLAIGPLGFSHGLSRVYLRLLDWCVPKLRRVALRNCELAGMPTSLVPGVYRSIARNLVCFARLPQIGPNNVHKWIRYEGFAHYEEAKRKGKGVLFATLHLGNWELSAFAHALLTQTMHIVVRPLDNPLVDALVEQRRAMTGNVILGKRDGMRPLFRALEANQDVGILVDQNVAQEDGIFVEFFGQKACVSPVFAKIAARTGATVLPGYAIWEEAEGRYVLRFDAPVPMTGDVQVDTQSIQAALERAIRAYPDQWLWIHRRWKTQPPGAPSLYH